MRIESINGVTPDTVNGYDGFRFWITLDEEVSERGANVHVFAQTDGRWKVGDEIELKGIKPNFVLNGPGEEELPDGEGTYVYAQFSRPQDGQSKGRFQKKQFGGPKPAGNKNFKPAPQAAAPKPQAAPAPAVAAPATKKVSLEEADTVYDRLLGESLRACQHTLKDFAGQTQITNEIAFALIGEMANTRARAIFDGYVSGRVDITPKKTLPTPPPADTSDEDDID